MRCLDLFSGIGGFAVGFHAAGIETAGFCEINPYARKVLATRFPNIPIHEDITTLKGDQFGPVNIIAGGFPCQDISAAGRGAGLSGSRSGLWYEMHRVISEAAPRFVVIENSPVLRSKGLEDVLRGLDALGYDAEWHCIPAGALGASHRRDRLWIVAYTASYGQQGCYSSQPHDNAARIEENSQFAGNSARSGTNSVVANALRPGLAAPEQSNRQEPPGILSEEIWHAATERSWWPPEPDVGRVAHGVPKRVDRLRCLGNAVVPAIPYLIGLGIQRAASQK
jgi:DNA (cytosine-5)-methyltransferase 1